MQKVFRNEIKYLISNTDKPLLIALLEKHLTPDTYNINHGYFIRSVYFDSHDDECLFEKNAGISLRNKYRIRTYGIDADTVKLEIKQKRSNYSRKLSEAIPRECAEAMIDGDRDYMSHYLHSGQGGDVYKQTFAAFILGAYTPKVTVDYQRLAYLFAGTDLRITVDSNIRGSCTEHDIFSRRMVTIPVYTENKFVLEAKYLREYPEHIRVLFNGIAAERWAVSKYTLGRRLSKFRNWEDN
jgi:hypothetical protein